MAGDDLELIRWAFEHLDSERFESVLPRIADDFEMTTTADVASEPDLFLSLEEAEAAARSAPR